MSSALRTGAPLLVGLAAVLLAHRLGLPPFVLGLLVVAQVGFISVTSLGLWETRSSRIGLALTVFFLLGLLLLPVLSNETSSHEPDPVWRLPEPAAEDSAEGAED